MTNHEFIKQNIGNKVFVTGAGDLAFNSELRKIISPKNGKKTVLTLIQLTKGGMALLEDSEGKFYKVPPRNVREI